MVQHDPLPSHRSGTGVPLSRDNTQTVTGTAVRSAGTSINGRPLNTRIPPGVAGGDDHTLKRQRPVTTTSRPAAGSTSWNLTYAKPR